VHAASLAVRSKIVLLAIADAQSPLRGAREEDVQVTDGKLSLASDATKSDSYGAIVARNGGQPVEAQSSAKPGAEAEELSMHAFGAVFAEVRVDRDLAQIRVPRVVAAYGVGNVLNAKTARSQLMGGIIYGIGMAMMEETQIDPHLGRYMNADLAEYHVPVNADIQEIDVSVVPETDTHVNPLGVKGIGEIGNTGITAALANAVYHATGKRIRDLPLTLDKVMA
jgi:xanthine dehydrogenase YagR molybdenum-binding subunit